jgi:beta-glucosidase
MNYSQRANLPLLTACIVLVASVAAAQDTSNLPYMNPRLSPEERAADLVHRMTLEEKASQLVNQARAIPRLGVPAYDWWSEALHGVVADGTTEFPEPVGLAATFDVPRIHEMATAIGIEGRIVHVASLHGGNSGFFVDWISGHPM